MIKTCIICGKEFESRNPRQLSCSKDCAKIRQRACNRDYQKKNLDIIRIRHRELYKRKHPLKKVICQICGKEFINNGLRKYCMDCEEEAERQRMKRWRSKPEVAARLREHDRNYKLAHREHELKTKRLWYHKNALKLKIKRVLKKVGTERSE